MDKWKSEQKQKVQNQHLEWGHHRPNLLTGELSSKFLSSNTIILHQPSEILKAAVKNEVIARPK